MSTLRRPLLATMLAAVLVLTGCGQVVPRTGASGSATALAATSGIRGVVLLGPTCPVQRVASPCPDRPIAAVVLVVDHHGADVARGASDASGHFLIGLGAGSYSVQAVQSGVALGTSSPPIAVSVVNGRFTDVVLSVDSGIR